VRLEFLGTGGAFATPRPGCGCPVCVEARARGAPYARTGPSLFLHGPDVLIDTPEESREQLNRAGIGSVRACLYSHWHPDHVMGRRVFESLNFPARVWPRPPAPATDVYLPEQVALDFGLWLGGREHLRFLEERLGVVRVHEVPDGTEIQLDGLAVRPFRMAVDYVYGFVLEDGGARALVVMDELHAWTPPAGLGRFDVAVLPMGVCEHDPFTGDRRVHPEHPVLRVEATFAETLEVVRALDAERVYLAHVEEPDRLSYDDLRRLESVLAERDGIELTFAYDGLIVEA
jgi:phosphoribosyl 1,2-cyclic phosphate phosphodiesterase